MPTKTKRPQSPYLSTRDPQITKGKGKVNFISCTLHSFTNIQRKKKEKRRTQLTQNCAKTTLKMVKVNQRCKVYSLFFHHYLMGAAGYRLSCI